MLVHDARPPNPGPRPERIPPLVGLGASSGLLRPPTGLRRHRNTLRPATASLSPRSTQPSRRTPASLARLAAQAHGPRTLPVTAETALPKDARGPMSACPVLVLRSLGPSVLQLPDTFPWTPPALLTLAPSLGFPWPRPLPRVFSRLWGPLLSLRRCFLVWGGCASQLHPAPALAPGQPSPGPQPQHRLSAGSCPSSRECRPRPPGASTAVIRIPKAPPAQHIQSGTCPHTLPSLLGPPSFLHLSAKHSLSVGTETSEPVRSRDSVFPRISRTIYFLIIGTFPARCQQHRPVTFAWRPACAAGTKCPSAAAHSSPSTWLTLKCTCHPVLLEPPLSGASHHSEDEERDPGLAPASAPPLLCPG